MGVDQAGRGGPAGTLGAGLRARGTGPPFHGGSLAGVVWHSFGGSPEHVRSNAPHSDTTMSGKALLITGVSGYKRAAEAVPTSGHAVWNAAQEEERAAFDGSRPAPRRLRPTRR